jgi:hypothetical protein
VQLDAKRFAKAVRTLPKSATTWGSAHLLRCTAQDEEGVELLRWLIERIVNAKVQHS